jgi:hypothetical protein
MRIGLPKVIRVHDYHRRVPVAEALQLGYEDAA